MSVRAVLFDVDGTLLDSNDAHALAWVETLARFGHVVSFDRARAAIGQGSDMLLPQLAGVAKDTREGRELVAARTALFRSEYLPHVRPFPGANELLRALDARGLRLVVATSASEEELSGLLAHLDAASVFDEKTSSSDVVRSKPSPDVVRAAVARSGHPPRECVMIGDTPYDLEAARRSGVRSIAFRCGGWRDDALSGALEIYDGPGDLLARLESSLLVRGTREAHA